MGHLGAVVISEVDSRTLLNLAFLSREKKIKKEKKDLADISHGCESQSRR